MSRIRRLVNQTSQAFCNRARPEEAGQAQFSGICEKFAVDAVAEQRVSRRKNEPVPCRERLRRFNPLKILCRELIIVSDAADY